MEKEKDLHITLKFIKQEFIKYNKMYFENKLPMPQFWKMKPEQPFFAGCAELPNKKYAIGFNYNKRIKWTEDLFKNVLLHEMIHLYIDVNYKIGKWLPFHHCWPFWFVMKRLNKKYGLNIKCNDGKIPVK